MSNKPKLRVVRTEMTFPLETATKSYKEGDRSIVGRERSAKATSLEQMATWEKPKSS